MLTRWIRLDAGRTHSLALTRQLAEPIPRALIAAVKRREGRVHLINQERGGLLAWADELRRISESADLVVLHTFNYDVVPSLAFAERQTIPPILLLDHADHAFWLGASISDFVIALRESGRRLAQARRHVPPDRSLLLPIVLDPEERALTPADAKLRLGLPENSVLLLSVARAVKYRAMHGRSFPDDHLSILADHPNAILMVVGAGAPDDWQPATRRMGGRIVSLPELPNVSLFQQAADVYVGSYPFASNTSMLETAAMAYLS